MYSIYQRLKRGGGRLVCNLRAYRLGICYVGSPTRPLRSLLFYIHMIYLSKQAEHNVEKKLCFEITTVTKSNSERDFFQFYVNTEEVYRCFASFRSEREPFTHAMCITMTLLHPSNVKHSTRSCTIKAWCLNTISCHATSLPCQYVKMGREMCILL